MSVNQYSAKWLNVEPAQIFRSTAGSAKGSVADLLSAGDVVGQTLGNVIQGTAGPRI
ncbi:MAG: hypothetical protein ABIP63_07340 [Thermoanaerobaculia bacterium]